eukprot:6207577-Pleurochrysis_carterae.AAC.2
MRPLVSQIGSAHSCLAGAIRLKSCTSAGAVCHEYRGSLPRVSTNFAADAGARALTKSTVH